MKSNRRSFIKKVGLAGAAAIAASHSSFASTEEKDINFITRALRSPENAPLRVALIGAGGMGSEDMNVALSHDHISIAGVCDLYQGRIEQAKEKWGSSIFTTGDHKEILKRSDVDAVIVGTPDHWHKQICIDALNAGKHVYCEKPMVHSVKEGHDVINAWRKSGKVFQVGSQGLSSLGNEKAKQLLAEGAIGKLNYAEGFWARHSPEGAWQYNIPKDASPQTVDWKRYISNTVDRPFDAMRFFRWRNYLDYGTAMSGDLFVHLFSSLHFITNSKGPEQIAAMGGLRYWKDGREVPDVLLGMFNYPDSAEHSGFNLSLRCNFVDGTSGTTYLRLVGSEGSMNVEWDRVTLQKNTKTHSDDPFLLAKSNEQQNAYEDRKKIVGPRETIFNAEEGYKGAHYDHFGNFFHAIRTKGTVAEDPIFGFRAAAPALLCNDSYFKNKHINWDPIKMEVRS